MPTITPPAGGGGGAPAAHTHAESDVTSLAPDLAALRVMTSSDQANDYTLVLGDAGNAVAGTKATAMTVTVPPNSAVAFAVGTVVEIVQYGAGQVTIAAGAGVTLRSSGGRLKTAGQYAVASIRKRATDEWIVSGDLTA